MEDSIEDDGTPQATFSDCPDKAEASIPNQVKHEAPFCCTMKPLHEPGNTGYSITRLQYNDQVCLHFTHQTQYVLEIPISTIQNQHSMYGPNVYEATHFNGNLTLWDTSQVTGMNEMFLLATSFRGIGLNNWNVSNVKTVNRMFSSAFKFNENLSKWDTAQATDMSAMFSGASLFTGKD
jgi:surface protein